MSCLKSVITAVADPDLEIRCGGGAHPDPYIRGLDSLQKNVLPFEPQFGLKMGGGGGRGEPPGSNHFQMVMITFANFQREDCW